MKRKDETLKDILNDPDKRRAWVIWQFSLQGKCLADIGRRMGVTRSSVYRAFKVPYPKMEQAIAEELGMPAPLLFPDRYTDGIPNRVIGRPKKSVTNSDKSGPQKKGGKPKKSKEVAS